MKQNKSTITDLHALIYSFSLQLNHLLNAHFQNKKLNAQKAFVPLVLITCEAGRAVSHTLSFVDHETVIIGQVDLGAEVHGDATPALKLVRVRRAVLHAAALVIVVLAGGAGPVVVGHGAAAQALGVTALARISTRPLSTLRTNWRENTGRKMFI